MKDGGGSASAPSTGVNSLAIAERQKQAPSCVAALFQIFAKRKLFSSTSKKSKLLPPVRAQKFSPGRPLGGGDTSPVAKRRPLLLDYAEYSRSKSEGSPTNFLPPSDQEQNCSEMRTPGVVARLMGLNSMPASSHQTPTKVTEPSKLSDHRNAGSQSQDWSDTSRSIYTSPQKQQKTERLVDDRQHGNASQFSAPDKRPLWPRRHAHKIASSVKSPRSMSSRNKARLIEAAAKVLEPGLQSRNPLRRHAYLEYSCNGGDGEPGAAGVLHNLSGQFLAGTRDVNAPIFGAHSIGGTSQHNSTSKQWTEEVGKCSIPVRRSDQNLTCQMQPEGNDKCLLISSSQKPGFGDSVQRTTNCVSVTNQDIRRDHPKNMSLGSVSGAPLKQNNQKQNALPAPCKEADPVHSVQKHKHISRERNATNTGQDFVSLNKRMTGSTPLRSKRKVIDRFNESHTSAENKNMSTKGHQTSNQHSDSSNKLKLNTATQRAMKKDMIIAKGAGLVSEKPKPASPNSKRSDLQRQAVSHNVPRFDKKENTVSFTFSSAMKVVRASPLGANASRTGSAVQGSPVDTCIKRRSRRNGQSKHLPREVDFREVQGTSTLVTAESVFVKQDKLKQRGIDGRAASYLFEKKSAVPITVESLGDERQWQRNSVDGVTLCLSNRSKQVQLHETHKANAKGRSPSPSITRGSNKRSPTSKLQSTYAEDAFISGIAINTVGAFTDSPPVETCTPTLAKQTVTTEGKSSCAEPNSGQHGVQIFEPTIQDNKLPHPGEVTSTVELLLSNVCSSTGCQSKVSSKTFLLQTIESAIAALTASSKQDFYTIKATEAGPLKDLAIDFVLELLDLMCAELCDSGYRSFSKLTLVCKEERLAEEIRREIARCSDMAGRTLDDLAVSDVEHTVEDGMNSMLEAFHISTQIEQDLVWELVNEIGVDISKRL
ncbi:hypothetical protein PR202_gb02030 [Eleusine coracana subsp. coracana]|uniref:DUF3741 domain-containing protein n=1 Tax=Eleusine coracana subsp. coracana TaxID=191504 RepID=A0AAV5DXE9_ELECO|nr:hypothetical protein PR202_gb02030 [Eleusine coracana subsp. coracana]